MANEKVVRRLWHRISAMAKVVSEPGLVGVALRGGNVGTFLRLRQRWLQSLGVRTVVDVGANVGQFADLIHRAIPKAEIHCFEPIPECFVRLQKRFPRDRAIFLYNVAIAERNGTRALLRDNFSPSSSLRQMVSRHSEEFPFTGKSEPILVEVSTLDAILERATLVPPILIKIDVQGAEDLVIAGGLKTLSAASVVILETSYEPLYENQPLFDEINAIMQSEGFRYGGNLGELRSSRDGRLLQADAIYLRRGVGPI